MRIRGAAGVMALLLLGASCSTELPDPSAGPELVPFGEVVLERGPDTLTVSEPLILTAGDVVRSGTGGGARIEWGDGQSVELAPDTHVELGEDAPELIAGSALIEATEGLMIDAGAAHIAGANGIFRLDRDEELRVGVYDGAAILPGSGWDQEIGALRQVFVTALAGTVYEAPEPLDVSAEDPWDARLLGSAIEVGLRLSDLQRGLATQLRGRNDVVVATLDDDFSHSQLKGLLETVSGAELVVAAQAALLAADASGDPVEDVLAAILEFRADGASWPLVVAQWDLERFALMSAVARVTDTLTARLRPPLRSSGPGGGGPGAGPGAGPGGTAGTPPGGGTNPPPDGDPGDDPPNDDPPPPDDPPDDDTPTDPPPTPDCNGTVDCLVDDVLGVATDASTS